MLRYKSQMINVNNENDRRGFLDFINIIIVVLILLCYSFQTTVATAEAAAAKTNDVVTTATTLRHHTHHIQQLLTGEVDCTDITINRKNDNKDNKDETILHVVSEEGQSSSSSPLAVLVPVTTRKKIVVPPSPPPPPPTEVEVEKKVETTGTTTKKEEGVTDSTRSNRSSSTSTKSCHGIYVDKPVLRGQFHKYGAIVYPPLFGIPLYLRARSVAAAATTRAAAAAATITTTKGVAVTTSWNNIVTATLLFNFAVESMMIVSGTLHTYKWKSEYWHTFTRKLDFVTIFTSIASLYSSLGKSLLGFHPAFPTIERIVWCCALVGGIMKWMVPDCPAYVNAMIFIIQGWVALPLVPSLFRMCTIQEAIGMFSGGVFVTVGALAYCFQWPKTKTLQLLLEQQRQESSDTSPSSSSSSLSSSTQEQEQVTQKIYSQRDILFGPHEMFHVFTIFMFLSLWYTMWIHVSSLL